MCRPECPLPTVKPQSLREGLERLGLAGVEIAVVHSSLSAFGWVVGGAPTVIAALRSVVPTLVVPAFADACRLPTPPNVDIPHNADHRTADWEEFERALSETPPYRPDLPPDKDMGVSSATLLREPDVCRSTSPVDSFAAVGPQAERLIGHSTREHPLGVLRVAAEDGAWVLLLGVDHTTNTTIHIAEHLEHRGRFTRFARVDDRPEGWVAVHNLGGDSSGFEAIAPHLEPWTRETTIGAARCRAVPAQRVIDVARRLIRDDPAALINPRIDKDSRSQAAIAQRVAFLARRGG